MNLNYTIILSIAAALIIFELLHEITGLFLKILLLIAKILIVSFEYFVLYRIWAENGLFFKITIPLAFIGFLILQILLFRKCKEKSPLRRALLSSMIIGTPIISYTTTFLLAQLFQIKVKTVLDMVDFLPSVLQHKN
ncbi:MAG: hypothetical protein ACM3YE_15660 [Bacteroidota bacterium]